MLWVVVKHLVMETAWEVSMTTGSWSGISIESCPRSQNQGFPGQPRAIYIIRQLHQSLFLDHPVKEPREGKRML